MIDDIRRSLAASRILAAADRQFLTQYSADVAEAMLSVRYELPAGLIHEDPQHHNALRMRQGTALIDRDGACIGPREWDLVTIEIHCRRFFPDPHEYSRFVDAYGIDIRDWSGYKALRDATPRLLGNQSEIASPEVVAPPIIHSPWIGISTASIPGRNLKTTT